MAVFNQNIVLHFFLILQISQAAIDSVINQEDNASFNG